MAHCLTLLASTLAGLHGSVHSKGLTEKLTPLESALTKNRGGSPVEKKGNNHLSTCDPLDRNGGT